LTEIVLIDLDKPGISIAYCLSE